MVYSYCLNDGHHSFLSSMAKSSFIVSKRDLPVLGVSRYHVVGALMGDKQTHIIPGKGDGHCLLISCCLGRCCSHQPIAGGKKVPLPCSSCGLCKVCFGRWDPMLKQAKFCLFCGFHQAIKSGWCVGLGPLWTCLGANI